MSRGITLLEVLTALAILAVLASLAVPGYGRHVERVRRLDAVNALLAVQQAQERWRTHHATYAASLAEAAPAMTPHTAGGHHELSTAADADSPASGYAVRAVARAAGPCRHLQLEWRQGQMLKRSGPDASLVNGATDNRRCWGH